MVKKHTALYDPVMTDAMPSLDRLRDLFLSAPVSTPGSIDVDIDAVIAMLEFLVRRRRGPGYRAGAT